nr:MAG TPA: KilAC domain protein [Caudoviricetes sp.]
MNELIPINYDGEQPTVSARELHKSLEISKRFSAWFETNSQGFIKNEDYTSVLTGTEVQNNGGVQIRELQDYSLSVDMAKHICLMSRTEKGKLIRQYFIDLEKAWNTPEQIFARALKMADKTIESLKSDNAALLADNRRMKPKEVFADAVATSKTSILVGELAKILKQNGADIGQNKLFAWMREKGYLIKRKGSDYNMPTQKSMEMGLFEIKETSITKPDGSTHISKTTKVTGKGQIYFTNKFAVKDKEVKSLPA